MREPNKNLAHLSQNKAWAVQEVYGEADYTVVNEKLIEFSPVDRVLVFTAEERYDAEVSALIHTLNTAGLELIKAYVPNDLDPEVMVKYVDLIIKDEEVDPYMTNRMIQQLIDDETYISDLLEVFSKDGKSPLSEEDVIEVELNSEEDEVHVDFGKSSNYYSEESIYVIPMTSDPDELINHHFDTLDLKPLKGLWNVSEENVGAWKDNENEALKIYPDYIEIIKPDMPSIISEIEDAVSKAHHKFKEEHNEESPNIYLSKRNVMRAPNTEDPESPALYILIYSLTAVSQSVKLTPDV